MLRKFYLLIGICFFINSTFAVYNLPTIAVLNLVYTKVENTPITTTTTDSNVATFTSSTTTTTTLLKQEVKRELTKFSADTKGALITSKQFKVVDMPQANSLWKGNTDTILTYLNGINKIKTPTTSAPAVTNESPTIAKATESQSVTPAESQTAQNKNLPDYILVGIIADISQDEDVEPIEDTNKSTSQFNIDISVDYQIISTKDNSIIASFNGYGHANDVKILTNGSTIQKQNHNIPLLVSQASKDLAQNVLEQLQTQFNVSIKTYNIESVTNLKVYN